MSYLLLIGKSLTTLLLAFLLVVFAQFLFYFLSRHNYHKELEKDNLAASLEVCGYFLAVVLVVSGVCVGESLGFLKDLQDILLYGFLGVLLLLFSSFLNDKLILYSFDNKKEILKDKNVGAAMAVFGTFISTGLIIAGSISGQGGGFLSLLVFFTLAQISLLLFAKVYDLTTKYDLQKELEKDNFAVGVSFGGNLIAFGIILFKGVSGDFTDWGLDLSNYLIEVAVGILILPLFRILFDKVLVPQIELDQAIQANKVSLAFIEAAIMISISLVYFFSVDLSLSF